MPKYSKQTYEMVAASIYSTFLSAESFGHPTTIKHLENLSEDLSSKFADNNPNFKRDLFMKACGFIG
jgi:hypothetical protein